MGIRQANATTLSQTVLNVVDTDPDPNVFQADLSIDEQDVTIGGTTVHALIQRVLRNQIDWQDLNFAGRPIDVNRQGRACTTAA